jgi:PKHD-type hydroxylase
MRQQWQLWKSELSRETCDSLVELCKQYPVQEGSVFNSENSIRKSKVRWVYNQDVKSLLHSYANEANRVAFGFNLTTPNEIQFTEYHSGELGHYDWHHDVNWSSPLMVDRKLSVVIQLTDPTEYEGGDFLFREVENPDFKPQGSILVFPSFLEHKVTQVTKGTRYSLVTWIEGPRWR